MAEFDLDRDALPAESPELTGAESSYMMPPEEPQVSAPRPFIILDPARLATHVTPVLRALICTRLMYCGRLPRT